MDQATRYFDPPLREGTADSALPLLRVSTWSELVHLRREVLRAGLPLTEAMIPEDSAETTLHVGAFIGAAGGRAVGCGTWVLSSFQNTFPGDVALRQAHPDHVESASFEERAAYRLRQMAIDADFRGGGVGRQLLQFGEDWIIRNTSIRLLWCDARLPAVPFYERQGWRIVSERFFWPTAGPHHRMIKELR